MEAYLKGRYTRFEKAKIIGARALQLSMGAPALIESDLTDTIDLAVLEMEKGIVPITVKRSVKVVGKASGA
ncbi:MAG: DNA-directed RNA polymerase subunit K [Halobacteriota archaeon]|nr:DNA-directed RNA polymerase subunit K [Halobacteriota archaeon]